MSDRNCINLLHQAMDMDIIKNQMQMHWELLIPDTTNLINCQLIRVYPQKDNCFLLHYEIELQTEENNIHQQLWAELVGEKAIEHCEQVKLSLRKSKRSQLNKQNQTLSVFCIPELGLVFRVAGFDDRLPGLKLFHKPKLLTKIISQTLHNNQKIKNVHVDILGHRLGKRCIARINYQLIDINNKEGVQKSIITKLYKKRTDRSSQVFLLNEQLWNGGFNKDNIRIPEPLAYIDEWKMILMEDVAGQLITEQADDVKSVSIIKTAKALAKFHQTKLDIDAIFSPDDEISLLDNWVDLTSLVFPTQQDNLKTAFNQIKIELTAIQYFKPCLVHRDFYEKQVLLAEHKTTIIDFDTTCLSDPAIDIGNYLAHISLLRLQGISTPLNAEEVFLSAYAESLTTDFYKRISIYKRSTLLRLICLYSFWPQWRDIVTDGLFNEFHKK